MTRRVRRHFHPFLSILRRLHLSSKKGTRTKPLPSLRKRALTLETTASAQPQLQSLLLAKLPPEIRQQIYEHVVGGRTIHFLSTDAGRLRGVWCSAKGERDHGLIERGGVMCLQGRGPWNCSPMPLLVTCRQVYSEAIDVLYSENIVHIGANLDILEWLPDYLLPRRFHAIRSLEIGPSSDTLKAQTKSLEYTQWKRAWRLIASMQGLRHILVWLSGHQFRDTVLTLAEERRLLEPLLAVEGARDFQVNLVSLETLGAEMFQNAPFQVNRLVLDDQE